MLERAERAQPGVLTDPTCFADFLTFVLADDAALATAKIMTQLQHAVAAAQARAASADLTVTLGFSATAWQRLFADRPMPAELRPFTERRDGPRHFPATPGDIFAMVKSARMDFNFLAAKTLARALEGAATLIEDIQGFSYLDDHDMIDFVDGTENPSGALRAESILVGEEDPDYAGGSYLTVQRYVHRRDKWEAQETGYQERVIGRTKAGDVELDDDVKPAWAHVAKSKVEVDGKEQRMFRQNRAFGTALEQGTMFVGFVRSADTMETSLQQMILADEDGNYDRLLDFVEARSGANYFVPPQPFLDSFSG
ncbi:MAG TPA: Dyp-type peroxidase [Kiloniellaceae bacterium]|nr:Dyp-type peroxidase [Kiloniellaceae bacterium]